MFFFLVLAFVILTLLVCDLFVKKSRSGKLFDKIPGPKAYPVIGNTADVLLDAIPLFHIGRHFANTYSDVYRVWLAHMRFVSLCGPEDIGIILSSQKYIEKGKMYKYLKPWLNDGILNSGGEKWFNRRKTLTTAFHFNILKQLFVSVEAHSAKLIETLGRRKGDRVDVAPVITNYALNNICESAMGTCLYEEKSQKASQYETSIYGYGACCVTRLVRPWLFFDPIFALTNTFWKLKKHVESLHSFTDSVIAERRNYLKEIGGNVLDVRNVKITKRRLALLDLMLAAEGEGLIDDEGIKEEVNTFMFEGHDTTAMGLCFILMLLANHRSEQDKAYEEIMEVVGDKPLTFESLGYLQYLEACMKEGLRLYPSVPFIIRQLTEDVQLSKYLVPAGTECCVHIYDLHRRADLYPEPLAYKPERFLPPAPPRHPYAYIPFSAGPRNCIGQKFATMQLKSVVASVLKNFILEAVTKPDDIILTADLVLRAQNPIYVKFIPRNQK